ncbi:MAG: hypothetical protein JNG86_14120, partial [Verrucomicrobiaceae bacterium]|nr:hypothetical protein [Verrucomicrobiaceae bacterium]
MRALSTVLFILITLPPLREAVGAVVVTHRGSNPNVLPVHLTGTTPFDINGDGTNDLVFSANGFFSSLDTIGTNRVSAFIDLTEFYTPQVVPVSLGA